jgi:hypothetical protein
VVTLHIEHPISDLGTWLTAFARFGDAREEAGVVGQRIYQPVDDDKYIVVALDFETTGRAAEFKEFLETVVWESRDLSPGLAGTPQARLLEEVTPT